MAVSMKKAAGAKPALGQRAMARSASRAAASSSRGSSVSPAPVRAAAASVTTRGSRGRPTLGRERRHRIGDAVIGVLHDQTALVAGGHLSHAPGHVVRLAAGVHEDTGVQMRRQRRGEPLRIFENAGVQIAGVGGKMAVCL